MKVLIVSDYAAPYGGNFICSIKALADAMTQQGHSVQFYFAGQCQSLPWLSMLEEYKVQFGVSLNGLRTAMGKDNIDLVYTHFCLPKTQLLTKLACRLTGRKLVQHWHNHYQKAPGAKGILINWAFAADYHIGCSKHVADTLPFAKKTVLYADNAIDFSRLEQPGDSAPAWDKKGTTVLMFGFDPIRKGVDLAVQALMPIAQQKGFQLVISLSKNKDKVEALIRQLCDGKIPNWITLVPARDQVTDYYRQADIFLSAAREEGLCYSLLEAGYLGCNLISSAIPAVPYESIPHCGVFASENVEQLREVLLWQKTHPLSEQEKLENRNAIVEKFEINRWVKEEISILEQLA